MRRFLLAALFVLPLEGLAADPRTVVLEVRNMTCDLCSLTVRKALEKVPGVVAAKVDFERKTATVTFDPARAQVEALLSATTNAGFPAVARN